MPLEDRVNPTPTVSAAFLATHLSENGSTETVRFTRTTTSGPLTAGFAITGSATSITDYNVGAMFWSVSFADGVATADLSIWAVNDSSVEGTENLQVDVTPGGGVYNAGSGTGLFNLYDDDTVQVTVTKIADAVEGGSAGTFRISRSGSTSGNLGVNFTTGGTATGTDDEDYIELTGSATITSGNSYVDVTVTPIEDNVVESGGETVTITITDNSSTYTALPSANASLTIEDDPPIVSIEATDTLEDDDGKFRITRTGGKISDALTVYYSVGGTATGTDDEDYIELTGSVVIGGGNSYADTTVSAVADNLIEGDETVEVTITSGSYEIDIASDVLTISDDPPVISVSRIADGTEGGADGTFRVSRTGGDITQSIVVTYTVGGTATGDDDEDYLELSGSVTIAANNAYADITIDVTNDSDSESTETVILTLDSDPDWVNGAASATLFIWDNEGTFIAWEGDENANWMDPDNWAGGVVPGASDFVVFSGSTTYGAVLSGPLSPYTIAGLILESSFTGTITLSFPLTVGSLRMSGGTIDQPDSAYGSDLTITGAATWSGGELNSTANPASVIFDGATVVIDGSNDLDSGSALEFIDAVALIAPAVSAQGTTTIGNGQAVVVSGTSYVTIGITGISGGTVNGNINVNGGLVVINGGTTLNSLHVHNGGTASITGGGTVKFTGLVPEWASPSVLVNGGILNIQNGTTLDGTSYNVDVRGSDSELNTYAGKGSSKVASIKGSRLVVGTGSGTVTVTIDKADLAPGDHVFGELDVWCPIDWESGVYVPTVGAPGTQDRWTSRSVVTVKGSTTSIAPILGTGATANHDYPVLESLSKFAEWANNAGATPGLPSSWSYPEPPHVWWTVS